MKFISYMLHCLVWSGFLYRMQLTSGFESKSSSNRQCLIVPAATFETYPPVILLGGMAQTRSSWEHHLPILSRNRRVIVYECLGQGKGCSTENDLKNVTLPFQAMQLMKTIQKDLDLSGTDQVDLVGFSFGARVAMATASLYPKSRIRKLHLSGVATDRSDYGHLAIQAWRDLVESDPGSLHSFAWSILMATYSPAFLRSQPVERYVEHICRMNSRDGILALLQQAEISDTSSPWHVVNMARRIRQEQPDLQGKLCVGELDVMSTPEYCSDLSQVLGWSDPEVLPQSGHAVGLEAARRWRNSVLSFLDEQ